MFQFRTMVVLACSLLLHCSGSSKDTADAGSTNGGGTSISAILVSGAVTLGQPLVGGQLQKPLSGPLVGYQLYCITFEDTPKAASGTSDSEGKVTVNLETESSFGCFIRDSNGKSVATVWFSEGGKEGQSIKLSGSSDFGTITVDVDKGLAKAAPKSAAALVGSAAFPCPLGLWVSNNLDSPCVSGQKILTRAMISRLENGTLVATVTAGPTYIGSTQVCGTYAVVDKPVKFENGQINWLTDTFQDNQCLKTFSDLTTVDSECRTATGVGSMHGCGSCDPHGDGTFGCAGCGTVSCTPAWKTISTRQ